MAGKEAVCESIRNSFKALRAVEDSSGEHAHPHRMLLVDSTAWLGGKAMNHSCEQIQRLFEVCISRALPT